MVVGRRLRKSVQTYHVIVFIFYFGRSGLLLYLVIVVGLELLDQLLFLLNETEQVVDPLPLEGVELVLSSSLGFKFAVRRHCLLHFGDF